MYVHIFEPIMIMKRHPSKCSGRNVMAFFDLVQIILILDNVNVPPFIFIAIQALKIDQCAPKNIKLNPDV